MEGVGEMIVRLMGFLYGEVEKDFCPNFIHLFLENIDPHRKGRSSPLSSMALTLECLVGLPSYTASSGREEKANSDPHSVGP